MKQQAFHLNLPKKNLALSGYLFASDINQMKILREDVDSRKHAVGFQVVVDLKILDI